MEEKKEKCKYLQVETSWIGKQRDHLSAELNFNPVRAVSKRQTLNCKFVTLLQGIIMPYSV